MVSQWGKTTAQQWIDQNNVQGYLEFFDSKTNKWIKPEKVKDSNNLKQFVHWKWNDINKNYYNDGTPVYDLSDISNYKVIRLISWMSSPYLLPAYNFFGIQTPLKYGTILAGTKDAVLFRESNTAIPTLVYAKYSDFDYTVPRHYFDYYKAKFNNEQQILFVHYSGIRNQHDQYRTLYEGERVRFERKHGVHGLYARNVRVIN